MLKIGQPRKRWSEEETNILYNNWTIPPKIKELSQLLNKSPSAIYIKARGLGFPREFLEEIDTKKYLDELEEKSQKFLQYYLNERVEGNALHLSGLSRWEYFKLLKYKIGFNEEVKKIKEDIDLKLKCYICKKLILRSKYSKTGGLAKAIFTCRECNKERFAKTKYSLRARLTRLAVNAKMKDVQSDLNQDFLVHLYEKQNGKCYYLDCDMKLNPENKRDYYLISLDRIDSSKGYNKKNVVLCCWGVNKAKSDTPLKQFIEMCSIIYKRFNMEDFA